VIEVSVLLHYPLDSGAERVVGLTEEIVNTEAHHLFDGQTLALPQRFQSPHFFI
jgi:hypothetical protein